MTIEASIFSDFWQNQLVEHDRQALFLVLVGFLGSFIFIRISTRLMRSPRVPWWPGSIVSESGVHLHHLVFGILTMMIAGTLGFALTGKAPWFEVCAFAFGIGVGLTIDEFALWVRLEDVYWAEEGRRSIDATVVAALVMALLVFGARPFEIESGSPVILIASLAVAVANLIVATVCFLKDRILHGIVGFFIFPVGLYGALRLGKPNSVWARRSYGDRRPERQIAAENRFPPDRRTERFKERFRDIVGGGISQP
ncbi:MAG: hypothetical protein WD181_03590 [Solirubrobacterales bacterium]